VAVLFAGAVFVWVFFFRFTVLRAPLLGAAAVVAFFRLALGFADSHSPPSSGIAWRVFLGWPVALADDLRASTFGKPMIMDGLAAWRIARPFGPRTKYMTVLSGISKTKTSENNNPQHDMHTRDFGSVVHTRKRSTPDQAPEHFPALN
jgi:hypothetical protein